MRRSQSPSLNRWRASPKLSPSRPSRAALLPALLIFSKSTRKSLNRGFAAATSRSPISRCFPMELASVEGVSNGITAVAAEVAAAELDARRGLPAGGLGAGRRRVHTRDRGALSARHLRALRFSPSSIPLRLPSYGDAG